jgi:pyruvate dehydrogenase E2 component (dihydrolipoamide acetyltransferase)
MLAGPDDVEAQIAPQDGQPAVRQIMTLTLSFDHRALDGVPAARILTRLRDRLERPYLILLNR